MIVAAARNGVIGVDNGLPWQIPGDLRRFKRLTLGGAVIMGRATFESIGRPLPQRTNIVMTRRVDFDREGMTVVGSPSAAIAAAVEDGASPVFVIGGAEVYRALLSEVDRIELTVVEMDPDGDTRLDPLDPGPWACLGHFDGDGTPAHRFHTLVRSGDGGGLPCLPEALVGSHFRR